MATSWISLHPGWYLRERSRLARRFPEFRISEVELERGNLALCGELTVNAGDQVHRFPVLLRYPPATPYSPPVVTPLRALPTEPGWTADTVLTRTNVRRMPSGHRRHQMSDGALCLVEAESFRREDRLSGCDLLRRAKEVFKASVLSAPYPFPDSSEAELESHFARLDDMLFGEAFYDPRIQGHGRFFAVPVPDRDRRYPGYVDQTGPGRNLWVAVNLSVESEGGLQVGWVNADDPAIRAAFPLLSSNLFTYEGMTFEERVRLAALDGHWYSLPEEPSPCRTGAEIEDVLTQAGITDTGAELERIAGGDPPPDVVLVGLRFPGRSTDSIDWLVLSVQLAPEIESPDARAELKENPQSLRDFMRAAKIGAVRVHPLRRPQLELRNRGRVPAHVSEATALILGCGALGGNVAVALAKAGLGRIVLWDVDTVRAGNVIRHVSNLHAVGLNKVDAVRQTILRHNPYVAIECISTSIVDDRDRLTDMIARCDVAVSTVADENVELFINEASVISGGTVIYGRALRGGEVARVFRIRPTEDACKACLSLHRRDSETNPGTTGSVGTPRWITIPELNDEVIARECGSPILAASGADLAIASDLTALAVLDEIGTGVEWNMLLWSRNPLPDVDERLAAPCSTACDLFPPHPDCPVCQKPRTSSVRLSAEIRAEISRLAEAKRDRETGGILLGYRDDDGIAHVVEITDAGPGATESATRFERDRDYCQERLDDAVRRLGDRGQYLGEWHSHLEAAPEPSPTDIESLVGIAEAPNYLIDEPVLIIAGLSPDTGRVERFHVSCFPAFRRRHDLLLRD